MWIQVHLLFAGFLGVVHGRLSPKSAQAHIHLVLARHSCMSVTSSECISACQRRYRQKNEYTLNLANGRRLRFPLLFFHALQVAVRERVETAAQAASPGATGCCPCARGRLPPADTPFSMFKPLGSYVINQLRTTNAFITWNSNLVPLLEGLCSSNPCRFEFSIFFWGFCRNRTDVGRPRGWQSRTLTNWASFTSSRMKYYSQVSRRHICQAWVL